MSAPDEALRLRKFLVRQRDRAKDSAASGMRSVAAELVTTADRLADDDHAEDTHATLGQAFVRVLHLLAILAREQGCVDAIDLANSKSRVKASSSSQHNAALALAMPRAVRREGSDG